MARPLDDAPPEDGKLALTPPASVVEAFKAQVEELTGKSRTQIPATAALLLFIGSPRIVQRSWITRAAAAMAGTEQDVRRLVAECKSGRAWERMRPCIEAEDVE